MISYCKSKNTFEPVLFLDVFSLKEGVRAFFAYYSWFFIIGACILIVLVLAGIVFLALKERKRAFSFVKFFSAALFFVISFCSLYCISQPVSYTHLDVYKRQGQRGGSGEAEF